MKITRRKIRVLINSILIVESKDKNNIEQEETDVAKAIDILEKNKITGESGILKNINNQDEFEDFIRYIFNEAGLGNKALGSVAMSISKDFLENPDTAASMSKFNF